MSIESNLKITKQCDVRGGYHIHNVELTTESNPLQGFVSLSAFVVVVVSCGQVALISENA